MPDPGAVSRQILALESFYQFALFKRTPRLTLTAEGELLLPTVRESFARIEECRCACRAGGPNSH